MEKGLAAGTPAPLSSVAVTAPGAQPFPGAPCKPNAAPKFGKHPEPNGFPEYETGAVSPRS